MGKNRSIEQKKLKMKRRGRFARFTGSTAKYAVRIDSGRQTDNGSSLEIPVGKISLSKQVMSTGRGPDAERMQEYYQRLHSYDQPLPQTLGLTGPMKELKEKFDRIVKETPTANKLCLFRHPQIGEVYLFYTLDQAFLVETQLKEKVIRRSRVYGSVKYAKKMYDANKITWVETLPTHTSSASLPAQSSRD